MGTEILEAFLVAGERQRRGPVEDDLACGLIELCLGRRRRDDAGEDLGGLAPIARAPINVGAQTIGIAAGVAAQDGERLVVAAELGERAGAQLLALAEELCREVLVDGDVERLQGVVGMMIEEANEREL